MKTWYLKPSMSLAASPLRSRTCDYHKLVVMEYGLCVLLNLSLLQLKFKISRHKLKLERRLELFFASNKIEQQVQSKAECFQILIKIPLIIRKYRYLCRFKGIFYINLDLRQKSFYGNTVKWMCVCWGKYERTTTTHDTCSYSVCTVQFLIPQLLYVQVQHFSNTI